MGLSVEFLGAAGCVTGSCILLRAGAATVLVDCGMIQGSKTLKALNYGSFPFDPTNIDAVMLTHAHVDHSGLLPKLSLAGFSRRIFATSGTIDLCGVLLPDAGAIQEMEVAALNRRSQRHGQATVRPIYTRSDAEDCLRHFEPVELGAWVDVASGVRARWWNSGHILGSASIEVEAEGQTLLFSGDVGPGGRSFEPDPEGPSGVDHLVLESTYGDVERPSFDDGARRAALAREIASAHAAGGPLLIPAFAVERTQDLIVDLLALIDASQAPPGPILVDSPLAVRACEIFARHAGEGGTGAFSRLRESGWLRFTERPEESKAIERLRGSLSSLQAGCATPGACDIT